MLKKFAKTGYLSSVYLFLYIPIIILIIFSFNSAPYSLTSWEGFTLDWYSKLFQNSQLMGAALNSLLVASASATIATVIGVLGSVSLFRFNFFGKKFLSTLIYILMMSPDIIMGISMLVLFLLIKIPLGFWTLLITHVTFSLPFVIVTILARLSDFDKHIVEAAKDLGADEFNTFRYIILPNLLPAVMAGWLLSFTISMDDAIGSFFVTGSSFDILPLRIYSMVRLGVKPEVNALSSMMFLFSFILIVLAQFLLKGKKLR